jgi:hypothetical protein
MSLNITIDAPTPVGESLLIINVIEANIESPRINAKVIAPSGDWVRVQANGNWSLDVRLAFMADDGEAIYCQYKGVVRLNPSLIQRMAAGESIPGTDLYLRAAPCFETASKKYGWLNDILAVGKVKNFGGGKVAYDIYEIL